MLIRLHKASDIEFCIGLVNENWGEKAADRCFDQIMETIPRGLPYAPVFCVLEHEAKPIGFAAYQPSMKMKGSFDLIWIAVDPKHQGTGAGKMLTNWRINEIIKRGGQMIELVTQKPAYFAKFGFTPIYFLGNDWCLMIRLLTAKVDI